MHSDHGSGDITPFRATAAFSIVETMNTRQLRGRGETLDEIERLLLEQTISPASQGSSRLDSRQRTLDLLNALNSPQEEMRTIHVAGTAGKGSVCLFLTALLCAHGFRAGTYTSPHVHSLLERFQIDGKLAEPRRLAPVLRAVFAAAEEGDRELGGLTMFEAATAAAFEFFRHEDVDYAVIETGIGGLRDATNTVRRNDKLAVITAIGLDHTEVLGNTLAEIAAQKAGILPIGGMAVALDQRSPEVLNALRAAARQRCCTLHLLAVGDCDEVLAEVFDRGETVSGLQKVNMALAIRAAQRLADRDGWTLDPDRATAALLDVRLPGRFETRIWQGRQVVLDGAHNPLKVAFLVDAVGECWPDQRPVWVLAAKAGKSAEQMLHLLAPEAESVIATEFSTYGRRAGRGSAIAAEDLAELAREAGGLSVYAEPSVAAALRRAVACAPPEAPVVVTGSFFTVADAAEVIG
ncbi:bifunctional folylpolyglutamate synthase/dihydrofolate synthase [Nocardia aurea]|uniref:bifunctional folylpolyglutamate synthase/dihydrofolate synthase n=1 Tax=Nocardia aurea TaxID=2144174 RepID=UPI000D685A0B|nr:cyanophycin synthetase [Nocardia aurea]